MVKAETPHFKPETFWEMYFKVFPESSMHLDAVRAFSYLLRDIEVGSYS